MRAVALAAAVLVASAAAVAAPPPFELDVAAALTAPDAALAAWAAHYALPLASVDAAAWRTNVLPRAAAAAAADAATLSVNGLAALPVATLRAGLMPDASPVNEDDGADEAVIQGELGFNSALSLAKKRRRPRPPPPPPTADWRAAGVMGPVKNQHINGTPCGCCWSFAATGVVEGIVSMATEKAAPSLSEQQLIDCDRGPPFDDLGCAGGSVEGAVAYIAKNGGLDSETDYPYTGIDGKCRKRRASHVVASVKGYVKVRKRSEAALLAAVAKRPVAVAVCCGDYIDDWHAYTGGIMKFNGSEIGCPKPLDHAVVVVGYGETGEDGKFWLVKNSWGDSWGDGGYFKLRRGVPLSVAPRGAAGLLAMPGYPVAGRRAEGVEVA